MGITSLWEDLEAKLLTPGQLLGYPCKVWGITVQTSYWEGRLHTKLSPQQARTKKSHADMQIRRKTEIF